MMICGHCNKEFESKKAKKFCSMNCYTSSDSFKKMIARNMAAGREKGKGPARKGENRQCAVCGAQMYLTETNIKRNKKTCSRLCYRKFMSERFDRNIGSIETIKDMSNYDEFLTKHVLNCLVDGCAWTGHNLSLHMNQCHGIKAEDFKRKAGFNLSTGVVSATMQKNLCARGNKGGHVDNSVAIAARTFTYKSKESREHMAKAIALRERNDSGQFV